jgi:hypothetical protein
VVSVGLKSAYDTVSLEAFDDVLGVVASIGVALVVQPRHVVMTPQKRMLSSVGFVNANEPPLAVARFQESVRRGYPPTNSTKFVHVPSGGEIT